MIKIHRAGKRIIINTIVAFAILNAIVIILIPFPAVCYTLAAFSVFMVCFVISFFRSPARITISPDNEILAPADGTIVTIEQVFEDEILKTDCIQISIFMSIFNVHKNWIPVTGVIRYFKYHEGDFLVARKPKSSSQNERTTMQIETEDGKSLIIRQIAGYIARRIVTYPQEAGTKVTKGEELGFIKFGSRVDILVPLGTKILVECGDETAGNLTPIAILR